MKRFKTLALLLLIFGALFAFTDLGAIFERIRLLSPSLALLCVGLEVSFYLVESWRVSELSQGRFPYFPVFRTRMATTFVGNFLPGGASSEVLRVLVLDSYRPGSKFFSALLLLSNRIYGLLSLGVILMLALGLSSHGLPEPLNRMQAPIVAIALAIVFAPLLMRFRAARYGLARLVRRLPGKLRSVGTKALMALFRFSSVRSWSIALGTSTLTSLLMVAQNYLLSRNLGVDIDFLTWAVWTPLIATATFIPLGVGALGPQEAMMALMAKSTGQNLEALLGLSFSLHAIRILGSVPGAFFLSELQPFMAKLSKKNRTEVSPS